jgi:hypothetical protein
MAHPEKAKEKAARQFAQPSAKLNSGRSQHVNADRL